MISLKPYVGKTVAVQVRQPHQMCTMQRGQIQPLALVNTESGPRLASERDAHDKMQPIVTHILVGEIKEIAGGVCVLVMPDPANKQARIETQFSEDLLCSVSLAVEASGVLLVGG